jgi:hypothetical protein
VAGQAGDGGVGARSGAYAGAGADGGRGVGAGIGPGGGGRGVVRCRGGRPAASGKGPGQEAEYGQARGQREGPAAPVGIGLARVLLARAGVLVARFAGRPGLVAGQSERFGVRSGRVAERSELVRAVIVTISILIHTESMQGQVASLR